MITTKYKIDGTSEPIPDEIRELDKWILHKKGDNFLYVLEAKGNKGILIECRSKGWWHRLEARLDDKEEVERMKANLERLMHWGDKRDGSRANK